MSTLRSILLHLDASPRSATRLSLARDLAARHEATVTALYATAPSLLDLPLASAEQPADMVSAFKRLYALRRNAARNLFDRSNIGPVDMQWRELSGEPVIQGFARQALYADLLVLGQHDADDLQAIGVAPDFVASVLIASGRPALVVPCAGEFATIGRDVLLAWKPTREAARAVSAAIPLLQRAQQIHVVADLQADSPGADTAELQTHLRRHGIEAALVFHPAVPPDSPGEGLLSLAADAGADLLVMGCYGHSRARELVLGGASRMVLGSMTLPVLMAH